MSLQDDAAWKKNLVGMGSGPGVPKLLHHNGKVLCHLIDTGGLAVWVMVLHHDH
jgi:hypothetical protein